MQQPSSNCTKKTLEPSISIECGSRIGMSEEKSRDGRNVVELRSHAVCQKVHLSSEVHGPLVLGVKKV